MDWSQIRSAAFVSLLAFVTIVGFVAAPVSAIEAGDSTDGDETEIDEASTTDTTGDDTASTDNTTDDDAASVDTATGDDTASATGTTGTDEQVPEEFCTDITSVVHEEVPYDQVVWVDDLPEDAQPSSVPWTIVTPRVVGSLVTGATPGQCDVVDPNDPPYDPTEDDVDPDGDADVVQETEDGTTLIVVNGTLNRSAEGPGGEATIEFDAGEDGEADPEVSFDDGEKDYGVDPGLEYWSDGTIYAENDVTVIGMTAGGEVDCIGEECNLDVRGAPKLVDYPSVPSHSTDDPRGDMETSGTTSTGTGLDGSDADGSDATPTASPDDGPSDGSTGDPSSDADPGAGSGDSSGESTGTDDEVDEDAIAAQDDDVIPSDSGIPGLPGLGAMGLFGLTLIGSRLR